MAILSWVETAAVFLWPIVPIAFLVLLVYLNGHIVWTTGDQMFVFDRRQRQLFVKTTNLLGRPHVRTVSFAQIQEVRIENSQGQRDDAVGFSVGVSLCLGHASWLKVTHPKTVDVSSFTCQQPRHTAETLRLLKYHQELVLSLRAAIGLQALPVPSDWLIGQEIPTNDALGRQQARHEQAAWRMVKGLAKGRLAGEEGRSHQLELARQQVARSPDDPFAWEQLAFSLAGQANPLKDEVVTAYERSAVLYRALGDVDKAMSIERALRQVRANTTVSPR